MLKDPRLYSTFPNETLLLEHCMMRNILIMKIKGTTTFLPVMNEQYFDSQITHTEKK